MITITPSVLSGTIAAPPSKSYAHRLLISAFLAKQKCTVVGAGTSKDVEATLSALSAMGLVYRRKGEDVAVQAERGATAPTAYCGESGSTLRFLLPVAAALGIHTTFVGESGLMARPIEGFVEVLNAHGARIKDLQVGGKLLPGDYVVDASVSSQYVTGLLFALPLLDGDSRILLQGERVASPAYIDVTLNVMAKAGVYVKETRTGYEIKGRQTYSLPKTAAVEGDWSNAAFALAAGALGAPVTVTRLNRRTMQGDMNIFPLLYQFGADVRFRNDEITIRKKSLAGITVDVNKTPDLAQILAVVGAFAQGTTTLKHVDRLRLKESDRVAAIVDMLTRAGIECRVEGDDLVIRGGHPHGAHFVGGGDHRTVMSTCILATYAEGTSTIEGWEAIDKSYPAFLQDFIALGGKVNGNL